MKNRALELVSSNPMRTALPALVAAVVITAACTTSDPDAGIVQPGCTHQAEAFCQKLAQCSPFQLAAMWKDEATCVARTKLGCLDALAAKDQVWTSDELRRCADQVKSISCGALFSWNLEVMAHTPWNVLGDPESYSRCFPRYGRRPNDTPCTADGQCSSGYCKPKAGQCGACKGRITASSPCTTQADCAPNDQCTNKGTCWDISGGGHSCNPESQICAPGLFCEYSSCVANKIAKGDPCDLKAPCDPTRGLVCGASKTCEEIALVGVGEACGPTSACRGDAACVGGTCVARAADGASCSTGVPCMDPMQCIAGTCQHLDGASCK